MSIRSEAIGRLDTVFGQQQVYADIVPDGGMVFPYAGFLDDITETRVYGGDGGHAIASRRTFQVDVWQASDEEDDAVVDRTRAAFDGYKLADGSGLRFLWTDTQRVPDTDAKIVHHALTFGIARIIG